MPTRAFDGLIFCPAPWLYVSYVIHTAGICRRSSPQVGVGPCRGARSGTEGIGSVVWCCHPCASGVSCVHTSYRPDVENPVPGCICARWLESATRYGASRVPSAITSGWLAERWHCVPLACVVYVESIALVAQDGRFDFQFGVSCQKEHWVPIQWAPADKKRKIWVEPQFLFFGGSTRHRKVIFSSHAFHFWSPPSESC